MGDDTNRVDDSETADQTGRTDTAPRRFVTTGSSRAGPV